MYVYDNSSTGNGINFGFSATQQAEHSHGDGSYAAASHSHDDGSFSAVNHSHPDGSYDINAADLDNISIGDGVGEAGSINATNVTIYLDEYTGGSWVNRHSVVPSPAATMGTDVDLSDSGTYPNTVGFWRIRVEPNSASADFVQGTVRMKYHLDN